MARISNYALDTNLSQDDRILGSSYEGMVNNKPVYKTRTYKVSELSDYFSNNFNIEGVNYNINELQDYMINLANSLGDPNQDGSLANISVQFANDLVAAVGTVPGTFTQLALTNLSAIPQTFADFLFSIANINETFANQVLDLASSTAYAQVDTFDALSAFVTQINENVQGLQADVTSITGDINTLTGEITANATDLEALGIRVTTAETDVVALETDFTSLTISVNDLTGSIAANATSIESLGTVIQTTNANVATLQTSVTTLESFVDGVSGDVGAIASDIDLLTTNVNTIGIDVTAVQTDVTTLTTTVNQNTNDIATQATAVSLLANRVDTTEADILNTQTDVTQLTTTVDGNTGNIATNASNIAILQTNVSTAQTDITGIITDIQQIETDIDTVSGDVTANATAITGLATRVTTAEADVVNVAGNVTTLQTDLNTQTGRIDTNVQSINTLGTTVTNNFTTLNASITTVNNARISGDSALSTRIDNIESQITNIPQTIRQDDEPAILDGNNELIYPLGSIWVDTNDNNALYILVEDAGAPSGYAWSPTTSEALGDLILSNAQLETQVNTLATNLNAETTKLETLTSQFGVYDPETGVFTADNNANIISDLRTYADENSVVASKVDSIGATFGSYDPTTNVFTTSTAKLETIVDALALSNYASTTRVDTLESTLGDADDALSARVTDAEDAIVSKPEVYRQATAPTGDIPIKSVWYDTSTDRNVPHIYEGAVTGWVEAKDGRVDELETYARASKTLEANANGVVTGINIVSENTGSSESVTSNITFKTNTFNIVNQSDETKLAFDQATGLTIYGGGVFTGTLDVGDVFIGGDDIKITGSSTSSALAFFEDGNPTKKAAVYARDLSGIGSIVMSSSAGNVVMVSEGGLGSQIVIGNDETIAMRAGSNELELTASSLLYNGQPIGAATDTNYYLSNITKSGNTLTFVVTGAANQSYTFGANAFTDTVIPTNNNQLTNGALYLDQAGVLAAVSAAGYLTASNLPDYLTDLPDAGPGAGTYGNTSDAVKIDTIEVDSKGRVVSIVTGPTGSGDITEVRLNADTGYASDTSGTALISIVGGTNISTVASGTTLTINNNLTVGDGTVSITGGGVLSGSGTFTLNQSGSANIEILHDTIALGAQANTGGVVLQSFNTDGYGHITSMTSVNLDGRYLRTLPAHNHNDLYYTEAEINSLLANYITAAYVKDSIITINGSGPIAGGGQFSLNGDTATITIEHATSSQGSTAYGGGTVIQNVDLDAYGHITGFGAVNLDGRYLTSLPAHTHDDRYYTEAEINSILASYATENYVTSALSPYALASSIPVYTSELVNNSGYITSSALTGYATETYVDNAVPSGSQISQWNTAYDFSVFGGTVSGNLYANDFILNSDITLKENIVDYTVKPINIQYKEYSFIGTQDKRVGVIAQELEVDHPEFIRESGLGKKSVSYIDLLLAKVAELEARIKHLEDGGTS